MRQTNLRRTADYRMSIGRTVYCGTLSCFMIFSPLRSKPQSRGSKRLQRSLESSRCRAWATSWATNPTHVHFWTCRFLGQRRPMRYRTFVLRRLRSFWSATWRFKRNQHATTPLYALWPLLLVLSLLTTQRQFDVAAAQPRRGTLTA
jgi:hypothetical protein